MPACITGAPGSGTSMTARVLKLAGLDLGDASGLVSTSNAQPDADHEHIEFVELNDKILHELGGAWDSVVSLSLDWGQQDRFVDLRARAQRLIEGFDGHEPWGWKDPRTSLTMPFWQELVPELKTVVCLRHPLDVALLLQARGSFSFSLSLALWKSYYESILEATPPEKRIVTHYDRYFTDPAEELARLAAFLGMRPSDEEFDRAIASIDPARRPTRFTIQHLADADGTPAVLDLYAYFLDRCGSHAPAALGSPPVTAVETSTSQELVLQRSHVPAVPEQRRSVMRGPDELSDVRARLEEVEQERDSLRQAVARHDDLLDLVRVIRDQIDLRGNELQSTLYELHAINAGTRQLPVDDEQQAYRRTIDLVRQAVHGCVPQHATVLVASRGDEELLKLYGRHAWHFPRTTEGVYTGYYPADSAAAIVQLEVMRALGAEYLVMPAISLWWLDHYPEFRNHLETRCRLLYGEAETCRIYSLLERPSGGLISDRDAIEHLLVEFQALTGRDPVLLDWLSGRDLDDTVRELRVFIPPTSSDHLPYRDRSVDVVALSSCDPGGVAEARRVASSAVIAFHGESGSTEPVEGWPPEISWVDPDASGLPSVSIVVHCTEGIMHTRACLSTLAQTLLAPTWSELLVVDDATTDGTGRYLDSIASAGRRVRVLRNARTEGVLGSMNRAAEEASGDLLVFLHNDTVSIAPWLTQLLRTFTLHTDAGVVGGRLLDPDGGLQEAGSVVFRDGSVARVGASEPDGPAHRNALARDVDYCSAALLATPRAVFDGLGGFDRDYERGAYGEADYCFRVRELGYRVMYQPDSILVHLDAAAGRARTSERTTRYELLNRERFLARWAHALRSRSPRPQQLEGR